MGVRCGNRSWAAIRSREHTSSRSLQVLGRPLPVNLNDLDEVVGNRFASAEGSERAMVNGFRHGMLAKVILDGALRAG